MRQKGYHLALLYAPFEADKVDSLVKSEYGVDGQTSSLRTYECDVTNDLAVISAMLAISEHLEASNGTILPSVLINAVNYLSLSPLGTMPADEMTKQLHANLLGPMLVAQRFSGIYYQFRKAHKDTMPPGRIVNIASQAAHAALDQHGAYCASKAGLIAATRSMAFEWAYLGMTANSISPGPVMTDLGKKAWSDDRVRDT